MFEEIYSIFKVNADGEEFDSDDDALIAANIEFRDILRDRDWKFLLKTSTLAAGTLSLAGITDLDRVIRVWSDGVELSKAEFDERYDEDKDYYIDQVNNTIVDIHSRLTNLALTVDYKFKPAEITADSTEQITKFDLKPLIAYGMVLTFYSKDQDLSVYREAYSKREKAMDSLIDYNSSL